MNSLILFLRCVHVEVVVKVILDSHLVEMLPHLLTPMVHDTFTKTWQRAALGKLGNELVTVLPLVQRFYLLYLTGSAVFANVKESRCVANLAEERNFVFLLQLEKWHLREVAILLHLVSEGPHHYSSCLTTPTMSAKHFHDAVLKRSVF